MLLSADRSATPATTTATPSRSLVRTGHVLSALVIVFMLVDSLSHIARIEPVVQSFQALGFQDASALGIGVLELACLALYVLPRTSVLGAILLTGYLGGAVAAHVRVDSPLLSTQLFPVYVGVLLWAGLYLRDERVRRLVPLRATR